MDLRRLRDGLLYLCTAAMVVCVLALVAVQVEKYRKGSTIFVQKSVRPEVLRFPAVSFCPGFKDERAQVWALPLMYHSRENGLAVEDFPPDRGSSDRLWREVTYDLGEALGILVLHHGGAGAGENATVVAGGDLMGRGSEGHVRVREVNTMAGRCYTLSFAASGPRRAELRSLNLVFNLTSATKGRMGLHFHQYPESAAFGLSNNFWMLEATSSSVHPGEVVDISLTAMVRDKESGSTEVEYFECAFGFLDNRVREEVLSSSGASALCMSPMFEGLLSHAAGTAGLLRQCRTYDEFSASASSIDGILRDLLASPCAAPRTSVTYAPNRKETEMLMWNPDGLTHVELYFESDEEVLNEEYLLLDGGALVSGAGGIVGMLLGWSALDTIRTVLFGLFNRGGAGQCSGK